MIETILCVMSNESSPRDLRYFIDDNTIWIWINHSDSIDIFLLINAIVRMTIADLITVIDNSRIRHPLILRPLVIYLVRPKKLSKEFMKLPPIGFHSSHCILLLTQG